MNHINCIFKQLAHWPCQAIAGILLLNLLVVSVSAQENAQKKMAGIYSYYRNGEEIIVDSHSFQLYLVILDTHDVQVVKPPLVDSFHFALQPTETMIIAFKYHEEVIIIPYQYLYKPNTEAWNLGYAKIYKKNRKNKIRHFHIPPQFNIANAIKEVYFVDYVYNEHRRLTYVSEDLDWFNKNIFSKEETHKYKKRKAEAVIIFHRDKIHAHWEGILWEFRGTGYHVPSFFSQEYFLIKDFRKYQKKCRKYWDTIESIYWQAEK